MIDAETARIENFTACYVNACVFFYDFKSSNHISGMTAEDMVEGRLPKPQKNTTVLVTGQAFYDANVEAT